MATFGSLPLFLLSAQSVTISKQLGFGPAQLGIATGTFFLFGAVTTVAGAAFIDRLPLRITAVGAGVLAGAAGLGLAGARGAKTLLLFLALAGAGNAALQLTANLAVARSVAPNRQGLGYGIKQSANPLGALLAGLLGGAALHYGGWRATYILAAGASLVVALSALRSSRAPTSMGRTFRGHLDHPPRAALFVSGAATALASSAAVSVAAFLPIWAFRQGMSEAAAGFLLAVAGGAALVCRLLSGWLADVRQGRHMVFVRWQLVIGTAGLVLLAVPRIPSIIAGAILAFAVGWSWPGVLVFAVVRIGRDFPGKASSAIQTGAFVGGASGPPLFGLLVEELDFARSWLIAGLATLAAASLITIARGMFARDIERRPLSRPLGG